MTTDTSRWTEFAKMRARPTFKTDEHVLYQWTQRSAGFIPSWRIWGLSYKSFRAMQNTFYTQPTLIFFDWKHRFRDMSSPNFIGQFLQQMFWHPNRIQTYYICQIFTESEFTHIHMYDFALISVYCICLRSPQYIQYLTTLYTLRSLDA